MIMNIFGLEKKKNLSYFLNIKKKKKFFFTASVSQFYQVTGKIYSWSRKKENSIDCLSYL